MSNKFAHMFTLSSRTRWGKLRTNFAGRLKVGQEDAEERIVREVAEESKVQAKVLRKLGYGEDERRIYYSLDYIDGDILNGDPDENDEVHWVRISNVRSMITTPLSPAIEFALDQHQN